MRCPACRHSLLEHDLSCPQCQFSLDALAQTMGIPLVLNAPLADLTRTLSSAERRAVLRTVGTLHQRFPQLSFAAVLMDVPSGILPAVQAFWLFNRGSLFSAVERGGDNHGVLLLLDTRLDRAAAMIGYGLEPFVSEMILETCLMAAAPSLAKSKHGEAIEAFARELERQLTAVVQPLPRTFGYVEDGNWRECGSGGSATPVLVQPDSEDLY